MTISELIQILEEYPDDAEVRIGSQPHYPFGYDIAGVWQGEGEHEGVLYILEGEQVGYLTKHAWDGV